MSTNQPKVRSRVAREAWEQSGAGPHGGNSKRQRRRDRGQVKRVLRAEAERYRRTLESLGDD